jgi:RNA polymerase sigma factor (sigma-70 family)
MDDATLVEAARSGDGAAWAAIYDRYADKLHDHCHRILRDRDEAADALHDAFIAASRNLHQLRDPSRLRPWLYSICRHTALRRAEKRSRVDLTDEVDEMSVVDEDLGRGARAEELQELVWAAAAGLSSRDQALLDLNLRHGLEGQDLADAMGTSLNNSYVMLSRLRDQVERSLGALLIARLGRDDCQTLDGILEGWDGRFSPLLRKRVARHVDGCDVCQERRSAVLSPVALLAAAPLVPAPVALRHRVLDGLDTSGAVPVSFTRDGFAGPAGGGRRRPAGARLAGAAVAVVLALVVGLLALRSGGDETTSLAAAGGTTTSATDDPGSTRSTSERGTTSSTTPAPDVAAPPSSGPAAPPATTGPTVAPPASTVPTTPPSTVPPDNTPPIVGNVRASASSINTQSCGGGLPKSVTVTATATDAAPVTATLYWTGQAGTGQVAMSASGSTFTGSFGGFPTGGTESFHVVATDAAGNSTTSPSSSVAVIPCPG